MRRDLPIIITFVLLSLVLFWPIFLGKVNLNGNLLVSFYAPYGQNLPYKAIGWDQLRIYFPFYNFTFAEYHNMRVPLWNPFAFAGHPHGADFQSAIFYPLNIFGLILPQIEFWHLLRITPTIMAAFFMYLFMRGKKLSKISAVFGAITFGFSPFILTWGEEVVMAPHSIVWLPLILWAVDKYLDNKKRINLLLIAVGWCFSLLGGYMQTSIYLAMVVAAYLGYRFWGNRAEIRSFFEIGLFALLGTGMAALQLLPSAELFFNSARSAITLREILFKFLVPIGSLWTYLSPDLFGSPATRNFFGGGAAGYYEAIMFVGIAPLVFALFTMFFQTRKKEILFWTVIGIVALSTALDLPTSKLFLSLPIPFLSTSIANRILFVPAFCLAVLGSFGMETWLEGKAKGTGRILLTIAGLYLLVTVYAVAAHFFGFGYFGIAWSRVHELSLISLRNSIVPIGVFVVVVALVILGGRSKQKAHIFAALIVAVSFLHIFYFSQKYFVFSRRETIFPSNEVFSFLADNQGVARVWGAGKGTIATNFLTQYFLNSAEGYDSLNNRSYSEFTYAMQGNDINTYDQRADANLGWTNNAAEVFANTNRRKLIDLVGIKYVIVARQDAEVVAAQNFKRVFEGSNYDVWENLQVMPRMGLMSQYEGPPDVFKPGETEQERIEKNRERRKLIFQKLLDPGFDFRNSLILEKAASISPQYGPGTVSILKYSPQELTIRTNSKEPKLLFVSDNYYPGWKATVDGDRTEILRADYTFMAIALTPGEHTVRFYFDSDSFKLGLLVSALSLAATLFLSLRKNRLVE
ncbi:YfhO family protein [Candidatus Curtissbacteria bacterium]|nr:YfhO family protein [Candidatus Curtissbacteria bacterium]